MMSETNVKNFISSMLLVLFLITFLFSKICAQIDEFEHKSDEFKELQLTSKDGEFDEFTEFNDSVSGEIDEFAESLERTSASDANKVKSLEHQQHKSFYLVLIILGVTVMAGFLVKYGFARNLRALFLLSSLVFLGFIQGACPCPVSSFQNLVLMGAGVEMPWQSLIWFLGLIPVTYFFGRVYCGWICHLGAIQEFLFLPGKIKILNTEKSQMIMRAVRIFLLVVLVVQIAITKTNIIKHYDPFKALFNLMATNTLSWILLGLLIISSLFIFRPFCKTVCPIGLILGWISKIPGARILGNNGSCTGCKNCDTSCNIRAITRDEQYSKLDNQECIVCGNCMTNCRKNALVFFRNNKKSHHDQIICKNIHS